MAKEPEQIELTPQEINSLHERINTFTVTKEDMLIFGKLLHFIVWMQLKIQKSQMTINKLKKIIFGSRTEKRDKKNSTENNGDKKDSSDNPSSEDKPEEKIIENNNSTNQPESNQLINIPKNEPAKEPVVILVPPNVADGFMKLNQAELFKLKDNRARM